MGIKKEYKEVLVKRWVDTEFTCDVCGKKQVAKDGVYRLPDGWQYIFASDNRIEDCSEKAYCCSPKCYGEFIMSLDSEFKEKATMNIEFIQKLIGSSENE